MFLITFRSRARRMNPDQRGEAMSHFVFFRALVPRAPVLYYIPASARSQ